MRNTVETALNDNNLRYEIVFDQPHQVVARLGMALENGRCDAFVDIRPNEQQVLIYTACPVNIPANRRAAIAEYVTRANFDLILGNFEMNYEDGELRYKNSFVYDNTFPTSSEVFLRNLFASFHMIDRYLPGIMSIIYANVLPTNAIHQVENSFNPSDN